MSHRTLTSRKCRWATFVLIASAWMSTGVLSDCDPEIAGTVVSGVGSATADLTATLVGAFFESIVPEVPTPVTTGGTST